jgi:hypothetical protein
MEIDDIWRSIRALSGAEFHTSTGEAFTYWADFRTVHVHDTQPRLTKDDFRAALDRLPDSGPDDLDGLAGPAHLHAILTDPRVRPQPSASAWLSAQTIRLGREIENDNHVRMPPLDD